MSAASTMAPAPTTSESTPPEPEIVERRVEPGGPGSPPGDHSQCMRALARANEVRLARAALKRAIASGGRQVIEVVNERPWEARSMGLAELLCSQRRWGRARSRKLLASLGLSEAKELGSLTERQQRILVTALEAKANERVLAAGNGGRVAVAV